MKLLAKYKYKSGKEGEILEIFTDKEGKEKFKIIEDDYEGGRGESSCPIKNFFRFFNFKFTKISLEFHNFLNCEVINYHIEINETKKEIEEDEKVILTLQKKIEENKNKIKILEIVSGRINEILEGLK